MSATEVMQFGLLTGYALLLLAAVLVGARRADLRPLAFAVGMIAASHVAFYVLFMWLPDVLDATETMIFSFILRYEVLGVAAMALLMGLRLGRRGV